MKSAEQYPEYQGDSGNIQFLTRAEHLEAHDGSWRNPTNWYFNPATKEKLYFGDEPFIPCSVFQLADPVIEIQVGQEQEVVQELVGETRKKQANNIETESRNVNNHPKFSNVTNTPKSGFSQQLKVVIKSIGKAVVEFPVKHPTATKVIKDIGILAATLVAAKVAESAVSNPSGSEKGHSNDRSDCNDEGYIIQGTEDDCKEYSLDEYKESAYTSNDVPAGKQRYHYKDGSVKWKDKSSYHRSGNDNE